MTDLKTIACWPASSLVSSYFSPAMLRRLESASTRLADLHPCRGGSSARTKSRPLIKHLDECISAAPRQPGSGLSPVRNVGIDIDGTITADPRLFSVLIGRVRNAGGRVHIVSSRSPQARDDTVAELSSLGIAFDALHLLSPWAERKTQCSPERLDWYEQYLWQKVEYAQANDLSIFFDDDPKVIGLFLAYAPDVRIVRPP